MKIAKGLTCTACQRNKSCRLARKAAPPRELNVNEVVGIDMVWLPSFDGGKRPALNCIDWGTHFQMMVVLPNKKPETVRLSTLGQILRTATDDRSRLGTRI